MMFRPALLSVTLACALFASTADAQPVESEAKVHYQKGVDLYNEGSYTTALAELEKAYALSPHYRVLYSLALVRAQLSDFVGALRGFQEYQAAAIDESAQRTAEVKERIEQLQQKVAAVTVKVNIDDAEVYVDDQLKGTAPFAQPILLNPGKHTIYARKGTVKSDNKMINPGPGPFRIAIDLDMPRPAKGPASDPVILPDPIVPPPPAREGFPLVTIGVIATGALAVGATVTGILALGARSDLESAQAKPNPSNDLSAASDKISTLAVVTDILAGAAIIAGGVTLYAVLRKKPIVTASSKSWIMVGPTGVAGRF